MAVQGRRLGGLPLAVYVIALLLIPLTGVAVFSARALKQNNDAAAAASDVALAIEVQSAAVNVLAPLQVEHMATLGLTRVDALGFDREVVASFTGLDMDGVRSSNGERLSMALDELDRALAADTRFAEPHRGDLGSAREQLAAVRAALDQRTSTIEIVNGAFGSANQVVDAVIESVSTVTGDAQAASPEAALLVLELGLVSDVAQTAQAEVSSTTNSVMSGDAIEAFEVAADAVRHDDALKAARVLDDQLWSSLVASHRAMPAIPASVFAAAEAGSSDPAVIGEMADLWVAQVEYLDEVEQFSRTHGDSVLAEATMIADDARRSTQLLFLGLLVVGIGSVVFGVAVIRAFARPLQKLRLQAERIGRGELHAEPLPVEGPSDLRKVTSAVNDMASTLSLVDDHMKALASTAVTNELVLRELPGEVGASMRTSMERVTALTSRLQTSEARLAREARLDNLTGLPNRFAILEYLDSIVSHGVPDGEYGVMFVDIDGFKSVNDTHGHAVGDVVLREIAQRLRGSIREDDIVSRLGGDEFLVLARGHTADDLVAFGERLIGEIEQPYNFGDQLFTVSASIGVSYVQSNEDSMRSIERADAAVYQAKRRGRRRVEMFDAELQNAIEHQAELELALRQAIQHGELRLHLQPIGDLRTGLVSGAEALVRWERPGVGLVPPGDFIPIAERSGLIFDLERWVLDAACRRIKEWELMNARPDLRLAVNISGRHLIEGELLADLEDALRATGADPRHLEIELTESQLLDDVERASNVLAAVRAMGVKVAIDDFGTGYSSMTYLQKLPVDVVKIDRSFMVRATDNGFDSTIVEAVVTIGRTLALDVVAEGIETMEQLAYALGKGVTQVQGFLLARPMPADQAEPIIFGGPIIDIPRVRELADKPLWAPPVLH
jgi:diguanylate cyclase (GGDEF)-like protein